MPHGLFLQFLEVPSFQTSFIIASCSHWLFNQSINQSINQSKSLFPQICPLIKRCGAITGVEFMGRHHSHNKKKIHPLFPYVFNVANWRETLKRNSFSGYAIDSTLGSCVAAIYLASIYLFLVEAGEALEFSLCSTFYTWLDSYHLL